jgi:hypothetical protein
MSEPRTSEPRTPIKLDFTSGLEKLPQKPKGTELTTQASVAAGREVGFDSRAAAIRVDGRKLRSRGATTQMNIKVTADEKETILLEASKLIKDPSSLISSVGEFVVMAVDFYRKQNAGA